MLIVNRAVLHILDFNSNITVFSQKPLEIRNTSVETFLTKHIEKAYNDQNGKTGIFANGSRFKRRLIDYLEGSLEFIDFSIMVAESVHAAISKSEKLDSADLLVCDINADDERLVTIIKFDNKVGFTHQVVTENDGIRNEIINHYAIMPSVSQKIDEYAFVDTDSYNVKFLDKKRSIDGQDAFIFADSILECSSRLSPKETLNIVNSITRKVAEDHGQNSVDAISKAKNFVRDNTEVSDYLDPAELGKQVFAGSPIMQEDYLTAVKEAGLIDSVKINKEFAQNAGKSHKIKTDTGIEITVPIDYFQNKDYIEFINNQDGTLSIQLKNIGKLINK